MPPSRDAGDPATHPARTSDDRGPHRLVAAVVWTILIMVLCWLPRNVVQGVEDESLWSKLPHLDKLVHFGLFVVFAILWLRVRPSRRRFVWVATAGFVLAAVTEIVQGLPIIGRDTSVADMLTDALGALAGIAVAPFLEPLARSLEVRIFRDNKPRSLPAEPAAAAGQRRQW